MNTGIEAIKESGINVVAVSYDSQEILKQFADQNEIGFPLLADPESTVIARFGLLNEEARVPIAHPMTMPVDATGVVRGKIPGTVRTRHNVEQLVEAWTAVKETAQTTERETPAALNFLVKDISGADVALSDYAGKVVIVVNVASECGYTRQYETLQQLYEEHKDAGLVIPGFPCNQFGGQEPGNEEAIKEFCNANYGVKFDLFSKIEVNGENRDPLYEYLTSQETSPPGSGDVRWNFEKFVIDRSGNLSARFGSATEPDGDEFKNHISELLSENATETDGERRSEDPGAAGSEESESETEQGGSVEEQPGQLIAAEPNEDDSIITAIVSQTESVAELSSGIASVKVKINEQRKTRLIAGWSEWEATDDSDATRPDQVYVPQTVVDGAAPTAVVVHMHGAVGRETFGRGAGTPGAVGYGSMLWADIAESESFVIVCPQGRTECAWWTDNGVAHVDAVLRDAGDRSTCRTSQYSGQDSRMVHQVVIILPRLPRDRLQDSLR